MRLFTMLFRVPWLVTLCGVAPLTAVLIIDVQAETDGGGRFSDSTEEIVLDVDSARKALATVATDAVTAKQTLVDTLELTRLPKSDHEMPLPQEEVGDPRVQETLNAYVRYRTAERFAGQFQKVRYVKHPWIQERQLWEAQVAEHVQFGAELKSLAPLKQILDQRIKALGGLEECDRQIDELEKAYREDDYIGVREIGDELEIRLKSLRKEFSQDPDVDKEVEPWLVVVGVTIDSATFQAAFGQWKNRFDVTWPTVEGELKAVVRRWKTKSKPPEFVLLRDVTGRSQVGKLDEVLVELHKDMVEIEKEVLAIESRMKVQMNRAKLLGDSVSAGDVGSLRQNAEANHKHLAGELKRIEQQVGDAGRLAQAARDRIESHVRATVAWKRYQATPGRGIPERMQKVVKLQEEFPAGEFPTGMMRARLQCDVMDWLRGLFLPRRPFSDVKLQEVRLKAKGKTNGWLVGRFEVSKKFEKFTEYKFFKFLSPGNYDPKAKVTPSFEFYPKVGTTETEIPRTPLTNVLIVRFNEAVAGAVDGFDDIQQWSDFAKVCLELDIQLKGYITLRGGKKALRVNQELSFERDVTWSALLLKEAAHLKALFQQ